MEVIGGQENYVMRSFIICNSQLILLREMKDMMDGTCSKFGENRNIYTKL
jgi:hypothetical protein